MWVLTNFMTSHIIDYENVIKTSHNLVAVVTTFMNRRKTAPL
ncbi:MAG: hypothetical protein UX71_C0014G0009 [Parcubacteria group bacterium GW2011_GWA1_47_10]|nr:MAG: hypothetical protein UX71_C0014G0009 [Parcubacteria group bacterium GW2011_GWA1_47_10]